MDMIRDIKKTLSRGGHIVIEAPTGFGKTISVLYSSIDYALKNNKKIIYLVRTNSQEQKVVEESKKLGVLAVSVQGRSNMCPLARDNEELKHGNAEELSLLCHKLKKEVRNGNESACPYFYNFLRDSKELINFVEEIHTAEEIFEMGYLLKICPYETVKEAVKNATVIVLPYIYFLLPFMRRTLLDTMSTELHDILLIVDEAHNFPDFARELKSDSLSEITLERMEKECLEFDNRMVAGHACADVAEYIRETIYQMENYANDGEGVIPHYGFEETLAKIMSMGINDVTKLAMELIKYGETIREIKIKRKKIPRSYIYHVGNFLLNWKDSYSYEYLHLVKMGNVPRVEIFCLDPSPITEIVRNVHSSVHISGTIVPQNYISLINLPDDTELQRYVSPFPPENLKVVYVEDVTTRYTELEKSIFKLSKYIEMILDVGKNTAVFFPSYALMNRTLQEISADVVIEARGLKQSELIKKVDAFRQKGGAIFSVFGGRLSEGIDFPGEQLEIVVIVGIPYPKPTVRIKMLEKYFDYKFGAGWDYAFRVPAILKIRQAIGRLIRTENDRGFAIILDKRAAHFTHEIPMQKSHNVINDLTSFFSKRE